MVTPGFLDFIVCCDGAILYDKENWKENRFRGEDQKQLNYYVGLGMPLG